MADNDSDFWGRGSEGAPPPKPESGLRDKAEKDRPTFYAKEGGEKPPEPEGFWGGAEKDRKKRDEAADALRKDPDGPRKRRRRIVRNVVLSLFALVLLVVITAGAMAPTIGAWVAPGYVEGLSGKTITGRLSVKDVNLTWGGPQTVTGLKVSGADGRQIATASVEVGASFWSLVKGSLDLGEVTVSGARLDLVRDAEGKSNLERALASPSPKAPGKGGPGGETALPADLRAKVTVKRLDATFTDMAGDKDHPLVVTLDGAKLDASVIVARPLKVKLTGQAWQGAAKPTSGAGSVDLDATVDGWTTSDGRLSPQRAKGDVRLTLESFPVSLVDAVLGPLAPGEKGRAPVTLRGALGDTLRVTVAAKGDGKDATAEIDAALPNASVKGTFRYDGGTVQAAGPVQASIKGAAVRALAPGMERAFAPDASARLDALPDATLAIERFTFPIPAEKAGLDLRKAGISARLSLTETTGRAVIEPGQPAKAFRIAPLAVTLESEALAKGLRVRGATSAKLDGADAGALDADVTLGGLLDASGALAGMPASVQGSATLKGVATAIAQPFVEPLGLDLAQDAGPTLDFSLTASSEASGKDASTSLIVAVQSRQVQARAELDVLPGAIVSKGQGVTLDAASAGGVVSRLVKADSGWRMSVGKAPGAGRATVKAGGLRIPRDAEGLRLDQASVKAEVSLAGIEASPLPPAGLPAAAPIALSSVSVNAELKAGGEATVTARADASHAGAPFGMTADLAVKNLLTTTPASGGRVRAVSLTPPLALRPAGVVEIKDAPASLVTALVPAPATKAGETALDVGRLIADSLGGATTVTVRTQAVAGKPEAFDATITAKAPRLTAEAGGVVTPKEASLRATTLTTSLAPGTVDTLLRAYAPSVAAGSGAGLQLAGPATVRLGVEPVVIPFDEKASPRLERVPLVKARVGLPGKTMIDGLATTDSAGAKRPLGRLGVQDFVLAADVPLLAVLGPAPPDQRALRATATGSVLGDSGQAIATLEAELGGEITAGKLAGPLNADVNLRGISTDAVERLAALDGLLSGLLGPSADVRATLHLTPPAGQKEVDLAAADVEGELTLAAPRLKSTGSIAVAATRDRVRLTRPAKLTLEPDVATINRFLAGATSADGKHLTLKQSSSVVIDVERAVLPRPTPGTPNPVKADLAATLSIPSASFESTDGKGIRLAQTQAGVEAGGEAAKAPGQPVNFRLSVGEASVADAEPARNMAVAGSVFNLFGSDGAVTLNAATVTVHGDLPAVPTALVDALSGQKGLLVEGLGPVMAIKIDADRVPLGAATSGATPLVQFSAKSARADANVHGTIANKTFTADQPVRVTVGEMTRLFADKFIGVTPVFGHMEKTKDDAPGVITASMLQAPLDGDLSRLNADVSVDPGQCRFETSGTLAGLLTDLKQKTSGSIGTRLDPLNVTIRQGVATYGAWKVPVGEFTMVLQADKESECKGIDLVKRQVDAIVWIPFGALADKAVGQLNTGLGSLLSKTPLIDKLTMTPWRISGPMDKPAFKLDSELWAKTAVKSLRPEELLKRGLGDPLKKPPAPSVPPAPSGPTTPPR